MEQNYPTFLMLLKETSFGGAFRSRKLFFFPIPRTHPMGVERYKIPIHEWLFFMVRYGKCRYIYHIHGWYGNWIFHKLRGKVISSASQSLGQNAKSQGATIHPWGQVSLSDHLGSFYITFSRVNVGPLKNYTVDGLLEGKFSR